MYFNEIIALKKIRMENEAIVRVALREISVLVKASHSCVVK